MKVSLLNLVCLFGALLAVVGCSEEGVAELTIVNQSNETVVLLQITVNEITQTVRDLKHSGQAKLYFQVNRTSDYHVNVEFSSGRKVLNEVGYLTRGTRISDVIVIKETDIEFKTIFVETTDPY